MLRERRGTVQLHRLSLLVRMPRKHPSPMQAVSIATFCLMNRAELRVFSPDVTALSIAVLTSEPCRLCIMWCHFREKSAKVHLQQGSFTHEPTAVS